MFLDRITDGGWILAIRERSAGKELFQGNTQRPFKIVRNPWRYWCADPFIVERDGKTYIFCEAFDILKDRGILAYRSIGKNGRIGRLKPCLDIGSHLSYPNVFCHNDKMYMIPESGSIDEVTVYEATYFPTTWQKKTVLLSHISACDTNILEHNGSAYLLTLVFDKTQRPYVYDKMFIFKWDGKAFVPCSTKPAVEDSCTARNAGNLFYSDKKLYRVSQNCKNLYGESISFHQILTLNDSCYQETTVSKITVGDIHVNSQKSFDGIHTYNLSSRYEIIDLQRKKWFRIERLIYLLICKVRRFLPSKH